MVREHSQEPAYDHTRSRKDRQDDQSFILYPTAERLFPFNRRHREFPQPSKPLNNRLLYDWRERPTGLIEGRVVIT